MKRDLRLIPLADVMPLRPGTLSITMSENQWDEMLAYAYQEGWILLELDGNERPVRAYQKAKVDAV